MQMMYYYWTKKGIRPSTFHSMPKGELMVIRAFFELEIDEQIKKQQAMAKSGFGCPMML